MSRYCRQQPSSRLFVEDAIFDGERPGLPDIQVASHAACDTGLLWPDGSIIWRAPNPIGFGGELE